MEIDSYSMVLGWLMGQAIASHRGESAENADTIVATLLDGILYIKKAPATLNGNTLEVG
jgi:hypothetical protein